MCSQMALATAKRATHNNWSGCGPITSNWSAHSRAHGVAFHTTQRIIEGTPALRGSIEDRLLITDSRGQHKDRRSQKRLTADDIDALEVETIEVPITAHGDSDTEEFNYSNF